MARAPRSYHHGDLHRALVEASVAHIAESGVATLSLRDVARRAGVSHAAPYRHFRDKDALLAAVAEEGFTQLATVVGEAASRGRSPQARLRRAGVAYVGFARDHPEHFRLMFGPEAIRSPGRGERAFEGLVALVAEAQRVGAVRGRDPLEPARVAWSLVHGVAGLAAADQLGVSDARELERFAARAIDALLAGLA